MQGLRLGTEDSSQMQQIIPQWGAVAVTLPPDEFALALRTHRIDGAESTLPTYVDSGYYLLAPYWPYDLCRGTQCPHGDLLVQPVS